jgi:hypothetical protein
MKHIITLSIILLFTSQINAKIWRVNNIPGLNADFNNAQSAHNAATAGDTIHLETSTVIYNGVNATKPLVWIGNGYFVDASKASFIYDMVFSSGSEFSKVVGLSITNSANIYTNNITIERCNINSVNLDANIINRTHDFSLLQSIVVNVLYQVPYYYSTIYSSYNYTFTNNIITGNFSLPNFTSIALVHNYINTITSNTIAFIVYNNIINGNASSQQICAYAINVYNNLFTSTTNTLYVGTNGNLFTSSNPGLSVNTIFVGGVTFSTDTWITLKPGSPAIGNGLGSTNIGPLGGTAPYKFNGIPPIPTFSLFQFQSTPVNTLPITISTRSNN